MSQQREFDISNKKVYLAIPCYMGSLPVETALEISTVRLMLRQYGVEMIIHAERGNGVITEVRNKLLTGFYESDCDFLFWLDDDIIFEAKDFVKTIALCTEKGIVGATYPSRRDPPTFYIHPIDRFSKKFEFDELGLIKAKGIGLGFTCISRAVVQDLLKDKDTYKTAAGEERYYNVFRNGVCDGEYWGEDINFFYDLFDLGHITYVDPDVFLKHVGRKDYDTKFKVKQGEH